MDDDILGEGYLLDVEDDSVCLGDVCLGKLRLHTY